MLSCALTALISLAGSSAGTEAAVVQGPVADVRQLPSGDVEVALDQGRRYLVARNAAGDAVKGSAALGLRGVGRAEERVDNLTGAAGDKTVKVDFSSGGVAFNAYYPPTGWKFSNLKAVAIP